MLHLVRSFKFIAMHMKTGFAYQSMRYFRYKYSKLNTVTASNISIHRPYDFSRKGGSTGRVPKVRAVRSPPCQLVQNKSVKQPIDAYMKHSLALAVQNRTLLASRVYAKQPR